MPIIPAHKRQQARKMAAQLLPEYLRLQNSPVGGKDTIKQALQELEALLVAMKWAGMVT